MAVSYIGTKNTTGSLGTKIIGIQSSCYFSLSESDCSTTPGPISCKQMKNSIAGQTVKSCFISNIKLCYSLILHGFLDFH